MPTNGGRLAVDIQKPYRVRVTIQGVCPLVMHAWNCESVEAKANAKKGSKEKKTDDVESFVYRNDKGEISLTGDYIRACIVNAAKFQQDPRSPRKSAADLFKAAIVPLEPFVSFGVQTWDYIDKRRAVVQRNAVTRSRPTMRDGWKLTFTLMCNLPEYVDPQILNSTIQMAGKVVGLAEMRPTYGRFNVVEFEVLQD